MSPSFDNWAVARSQKQAARARASMAPVVYENEESLISACRQALLVDPDVSPAALLEIVGEGSGAPIWASGQKISLNSVEGAARREDAARRGAGRTRCCGRERSGKQARADARAIEFAEKNHGAGARSTRTRRASSSAG